MFPEIETIDDVLPFIKDKSEIAVIQKDNYTVIDYLFAGVNTFDNNVARECRGLKFDKNGKLIGRPFHKFFNLNEVEETKFEKQDWQGEFTVYNKWDGSMIHPALVDGELVFMTRKGVTDVALRAMQECSYDKDEMVKLIKDGYTPIYEFISPNNKIVLHYDKPQLIPLNARHMRLGFYDNKLINVGSYEEFYLNYIKKTSNVEEFLEEIKESKNVEGVVIQFDIGQYFSRFIKFKADDYVALHRVIDETAHEKRVLALIMMDKLDDVIPLIAPERAKHLKVYADVINKELYMMAHRLVEYVYSRQNFSQKDFALEVQSYLSKEYQVFAFKARSLDLCDVPSVVAMFKEFFKKTLTTQAKVDQWRNFLGNPKFDMEID